jgi:hypothetical protein
MGSLLNHWINNNYIYISNCYYCYSLIGLFHPSFYGGLTHMCLSENRAPQQFRGWSSCPPLPWLLQAQTSTSDTFKHHIKLVSCVHYYPYLALNLYFLLVLYPSIILLQPIRKSPTTYVPSMAGSLPSYANKITVLSYVSVWLVVTTPLRNITQIG